MPAPGGTIFVQLMEHLPRHEFRKSVTRYRGDHRVRRFSCYDQFLCLAFAQLTYRESLRDIEACLNSMGQKLYHRGFRGEITRSTLADANENRDWRIYADFAMVLIGQARELYTEDSFGVNLKNAAYALDATTIDLCLSVFPWAKFRKTKGGVKASVLLDLRGNIPAFIHICPANAHEVKVLDLMVFEAGAFYIVDRGYLAAFHVLGDSLHIHVGHGEVLHQTRLPAAAALRVSESTRPPSFATCRLSA